MIVEVLFVVGAVATGVCLARGRRRAGVAGVLAGLVVVGLYVGCFWVSDLYAAAAIASTAYAMGMVVVLLTRPGVDADRARLAPPASGERLRRGVIGALVGVIPGALVIAVPLLLHAMGAISADASQIGFLGVFLAPIGVVAGALVGASTASHPADGGPSGSTPASGLGESLQPSRRQRVGLTIAWAIAVPLLAVTLLLEWGLTSEYGLGLEDEAYGVGSMIRDHALYAAPAAVLTALAVGLSLRAWGRRQAVVLVGTTVTALAVLGVAFGVALGADAARTSGAAANCTPHAVEILRSLPLDHGVAEDPQGAPSGGCYVRYTVDGDAAGASDVLTAELATAGWTPQDAERFDPGWQIYVGRGLLFAEIEGYGNLQDIPTDEGVTVFRLTVFEEAGPE